MDELRVECICDDGGVDRCIIHRGIIHSTIAEPIRTGAQLRQIAELENPTLRTPQQQIESLLMMATLAQGQLKEAMNLLKFRDRQIEAALDGLESIGANTCCDKCQEAALVAKSAIDKMREIHKESLTSNPTT